MPGAARRENLVKYRQQALLSRELVRLDAHVPVAIDWQAGRPGRRAVPAHAAQLFEEFGFRRLAEKLAAMTGVFSASVQSEGTKISCPQPLDDRTTIGYTH